MRFLLDTFLMLMTWSLLYSTLLAIEDSENFVDESHADFVAGKMDDGGHNLYAGADGTLRTINRFDLNMDGHLDLLFNCTHNTYQMLPATAGQINQRRQSLSVDVAVEGSQNCAIFDLNQDGYRDIVFCPNSIGVHHNRRFISIAWGSPEGWTSHRINSPLPMDSAAKVEVTDLNGDGWGDISILGGPRWQPDQPHGRIIRTYWGSKSGFGVPEFVDSGVVQAVDFTAGDFNGDGFRDLAVLRSDRKITIFWSRKDQTQRWIENQSEHLLPLTGATCVVAGDVTGDVKPEIVIGSSNGSLGILKIQDADPVVVPEVIEGFPATHITVSDLDADHKPDIVLTQFDQARAAGGEQAGAGKNAIDVIRILWGNPQGYSRQGATSIAVPFAVATAAGDLDRDGKIDLAIAVHQGKTTFNGESLAYFGDGQRNFLRSQEGFCTSGTLHVAIAPAELSLPARVVFCNSIGGELDESVPLHLYWGGPQGFDTERLWKLPFHSGYESSAADLNRDGFPDLLILNSGHAGDHSHADPTLGANILWGSTEGLEKSQKRTVLHEHFLGTSGIADLNKDGWLDLVLEPFSPEHGGEKEKLILYYGGEDGFPANRRVALTMDGYAQEHLIADFNNDQWLDIGVTSRSLGCVRILWGSEKGFDVTHDQRLKIAGPVGVDAADLNRDGYLDLLSASYNDPVAGFRDMGLVIFWGHPNGYDHSNAQWLPGFSPLGRTIADFDGDGHLDIFSPQHSGELTREDLACHLYWGSDTGFATRRRTTLFCDSVNDSMAADFNGDGKIDLAVNCHTRHGDHRTKSNVFYNDGARFAEPKIQKLPTNGPHLLWAEDVGHIYDRKYRQSFTSRIFNTRKKVRSLRLKYTGETPDRSRLEFFVKFAAEKEQLTSVGWQAVTNEKFPIKDGLRFFQYRADFLSPNGDRFPVLDRVELILEP